MEYTRNLVSVSLIVIGSHLFIHEVVLAVRGIINMFNTTSGNQAVITAQGKLDTVNADVTSLNTIVTAMTGPSASIATNNINTLVSSFALKLTTLQSNLSALSLSLASSVSTTTQINTQVSTISSGITDLTTTGTSLYQAINTATATIQGQLAQYSNLPGLISALKIDWDSATPSVTTAGSSLSTGSSLGFGDVITILTGVFGFNETQFVTYFQSISANSIKGGTIAASVIRILGVILFSVGIFILANGLKFNFFGIQVGDVGA